MTSSISHRKATSEGRRPGGWGKAMALYDKLRSAAGGRQGQQEEDRHTEHLCRGVAV